MLASFSAELFKLRKRGVLWLVAGVWLVLTLVFGYVFPYLSYTGTPTGPSAGGRVQGEALLSSALPEGLASTAIQGFPLFAGALALLIGVLCAGDEFGWQTVKVIFTQGPRRVSVLAGKISALWLVILCIVLLTFVVDGMASWLVATLQARPTVWPAAGELATALLGGWLIVGMWATAGLFLGIMVRGTALAVGLGLVWTLALENLLRGFGAMVEPLDAVQRWLPGTNAGSLASALGVDSQGQAGGTPGVTAAVGGTQATVVLLCYVVVFAVISALVLSRRDVS